VIESFQYQLQRERFEEIHATRADMVVIDIDDCCFTADQIAAIASRRTMLSYLSVGQASNFRTYWTPAWVDEHGERLPAAPAWLGAKCAWPGSYEVRYWDEAWLAIMGQAIDRILELGYAGCVYDVVDAYAYWEKQGEWTAKSRMKKLVIALMAHGRAIRPDFIGIPNSGVELLTDAAYRSCITAQMRESVFYMGDEARSKADTEWVTKYLDLVTADGKQVFDLEYPSDLGSQKDAIRQARAKGYVPYTTSPRLDALAPVWQDVLRG
jgi:cysteinyl-tRNA synthetase, unknown class